jgi:hypothetical protein
MNNKKTLEKRFPKSPNQVIDFANELRREGAKWQAERMYSEEEVLKLLEKYAKDISELNMKTPIWNRPVFEKAIYWFEKFKKK